MQNGHSKPEIDFSAARRLVRAVAEKGLDGSEAVGIGSGGDPGSIPGYTLSERIGGGGGGVVFRALREGSARPVALKILSAELSAGLTDRSSGSPQGIAARAWRELDLLESLRLPAVPRLLDYGVHGGRLFIATEFVEGRPLSAAAGELRSDTRRCVTLLAKIADAVQSLHEHGVIHRDIKPANIIITAGGDPVIVDLGLAGLIDRNFDSLGGDQPPTPTIDGVPLGTPAFMAPEQARGERGRISTRSDIFGLGATAYWLLIGQTPHDTGCPLHEAIRRIAQDPPRPAELLDARLPRALAAVLTKAVQARPEDRYTTAAHFAADLRRWLNGEPVLASVPGLAVRLSRWVARHPKLATTTTCLAIAVLAIGLTFSMISYFNSQPARVAMDDPTGMVARLYSVAGRELYAWDTGLFQGIRYAGFYRHPSGVPGTDVAVLGFSRDSRVFPAGELCGFDADDPSKILWRSVCVPPQIEMPKGLLTSIDGKEFTAPQAFRIQWVLRANIFPQVHEPQLVACFWHYPNSPACVRVYGAISGRVLDEFWHDGYLHAAYWMPTHNLLVLSGVNSEVTWDRREYDGERPSNYPLVVFAVTPQLDRHKGLVQTTSLPGDVVPAWYKCVTPPMNSAIYNGTTIDHNLDLITLAPAHSADDYFGVVMTGVLKQTRIERQVKVDWRGKLVSCGPRGSSSPALARGPDVPVDLGPLPVLASPPGASPARPAD